MKTVETYEHLRQGMIKGRNCEHNGAFVIIAAYFKWAIYPTWRYCMSRLFELWTQL